MPFDLRPLGYDADSAKAFLQHLSPAGRDFYLNVQHKLDTAYPALLALALASGIAALAPKGRSRWKWLLSATAFPGMVFDYT